MRIHHLNCVSACPLGGVLMDGIGGHGLRGRLTSHCLLAESADGLVLVDTGYGLEDVADPRSRLNALFLFLNEPRLEEGMTAVRQVEAMGHRASDVRHIVLTHLDFDHAGGLDDFPQARIHLLETERATATARRTVLDRMRYRPQQWSSQARWLTYITGGEPWLGFECVRGLAGLKDEVLLVPLPGHTLGHAAVALKRDGDWLLLAGDAYFHHREMDLEQPWCTPGLALYQALMEKDRPARLANQARLRELKRARGALVDIICSHDVREFEAHAGHAAAVPTGPLRAVPA